MLSLKNRKTPVQNKKDDETWQSIALHYLLVSGFVFCGHGLFVFLDSVSVLRFNSVLFRVPFRLGMLISALGFVFLFSGSVFLFWVSVLSYVFLFCLFFWLVLCYFCYCWCLVVFLFLSATLYIWKSSAFKSNHWRTLQNSVENFFTEIKSSR